jgi:hypothetical protein
MGDQLMKTASVNKTLRVGGFALHPFDAAQRVVKGDPRRIGLAAGGNTLYHPMMASASAHLLAFVNSPLPFAQRLGSSRRNGEDLKIRGERVPAGPAPRQTAGVSLSINSRRWPGDCPCGSRISNAEHGCEWFPQGRPLLGEIGIPDDDSTN